MPLLVKFHGGDQLIDGRRVVEQGQNPIKRGCLAQALAAQVVRRRRDGCAATAAGRIDTG
jgi:hypothetical protein